MSAPTVTAEALREVLTYDPATGSWTWKYRTGGPANWNARYANTLAGSKCSSTGYWRITIGGVPYFAHRLAFLYMLGRWPRLTDHRNLDKCDCSWANLREATRSQNEANKRGQNSTGFKGVFAVANGTFRCQVVLNGKRYRKYGFATAKEASQAYGILAQEIFGEFARVG